MALDWLVRTYTAAWLTVARLPSSARQLECLPPVVDADDLLPALNALTATRQDSRGSWCEALGPARAAARTPWAAGRAAACEVAWGSAGAAAWAAARLGVGDITGDRARAMAREIAGDAAAMVAREARSGMGRAAAREAARQALAPTVEELRTSVFALLDRMLPTEPLAAPRTHTSGERVAVTASPQ
jgi:hypothetical protein